jgi:hypothetical protein
MECAPQCLAQELDILAEIQSETSISTQDLHMIIQCLLKICTVEWSSYKIFITVLMIANTLPSLVPYLCVQPDPAKDTPAKCHNARHPGSLGNFSVPHEYCLDIFSFCQQCVSHFKSAMMSESGDEVYTVKD